MKIYFSIAHRLKTMEEEQRKRGDKRKKKEKKEEGMFLLYSSFSPIENTNIKHDLNNDTNRHDMMEEVKFHGTLSLDREL